MARAPAVRTPILQEVEALPEADRLEGFAHPRNTEALYGHATAEADFASFSTYCVTGLPKPT